MYSGTVHTRVQEYICYHCFALAAAMLFCYSTQRTEDVCEGGNSGSGWTVLCEGDAGV